MQISVSSYSFSQYTNHGKLSMKELIGKAKEMGFDGIEYTNILDWDGHTPEENAAILREEAERVGIPIIHYTIGADFLCAKGADYMAEQLFREVDICEILGAKALRHDVTTGFPKEKRAYLSYDQAIEIAAPAIRKVTEYAASKGISTSTENHGRFSQDAERVASLIGAVGHPNFGALVDIGNFVCADEDPLHAVGILAPMAKHVHAKDFHVKSGNAASPGEGFFRSRGGNYLMGCNVGHGDVPVYQCLGILKREGYDGYISVEYEGNEDTFRGVRISKDNIARYWAQA
ncbi:MAG: sugar phosphate isomerase/epimerase [Oscillospiraceae bacterium]|jgi:sugar phosphate isomerase/epimerase|nr:sugar phosphate isomerase/epimerase [Oscillospiraceae bacterium]